MLNDRGREIHLNGGVCHVANVTFPPGRDRPKSPARGRRSGAAGQCVGSGARSCANAVAEAARLAPIRDWPGPHLLGAADRCEAPAL